MALHHAGDRAVIGWKRLYMKPAGSLPGGVVTQYGVGAITVFMLLFLTYWIWFGGGEPAELPGAAQTQQAAPKSFTDRMADQVDTETLRAKTRKAAADRILRAQQQQQTNTAGVGAGRVTAKEAILLAGPSPDTGQPYTEAEWNLREGLRLEALERRSRSLRSSPIAQTYRKLGGGAAASERPVAATKDPLEAMAARGDVALQQALNTIETAATGLEDQITAEAQADQAFIEALSGRPGAAESAPIIPTASVPPGAGSDYSSPSRIGQPEDPPGWERIHEGSFLEAVLVSQLSGDFPGPVLAVVAVPFYSADRQRILIPRGTRIIGTAAAVANQDQSRLAVSFQRLILPGWPLDFARFSRPQSRRGGSLERSSQPPLLFDVCRCRSRGRPERTHGAAGQPLRGRSSGLPGQRRAGPRPGRYAHPGSFLESYAHHHNPRRAPPPRLVHV